MPLIKSLLAKVQRQNLFSPGETVVVAVSGGADSVALLDMLARLDPGLNLIVAHLNHCLRGAASDGDEAFVAGLAAAHSLPFVVGRVDVAGFASASRLSLEDAARRARYAFLTETAEAHGATSIALAHHLDDQAETVLIRLLRGAGSAGLSAMAPVSGKLLKRPLLQVSRAEIEQYLKERGLTCRTDESNADTAILRNSIRHELIPFLKKYNPRVSERLAATAEILSSDEELLETVTAAAYARTARGEGLAVALDLAALGREPRGLRLRLYRRALLEQRGDLQRIALTHLDAVDSLVMSGPPNGSLKLPGACFVERDYDSIYFRTSAATAGEGWALEIPGEGNHPLPGGGSLSVQLVPKPSQLDPGSRLIAYLDAGAAPFPWLLRSFQPGDRFTPLGMPGEQKVKEIFINEKVPARERNRVPLLVSGGTIVWIGGVRMGEKVRVKGSTEAVVRVEILDFTP